MSMTDLKALGLSWFMGARKLPAAPALLGGGCQWGGFAWVVGEGGLGAHITKSMLPSCWTHFSTAPCRLEISRTSMEPRPRTLEPARAVAMSRAMRSVFWTLRPIMQAFAPRWTIARTWALQMVPPPPVQKTTLLSMGCYELGCWDSWV